jgi:hypothetical protein
MFRSLLLAIAIIAGPLHGEASSDSNCGIKFGILRSRLEALNSTNYLSTTKFELPRLGPTIGVFHKRTLAKIPFDATLSYKQEGGIEKLLHTSPQYPNGNGDYSVEAAYYDLIDLEISARPGKQFEHIGIFAILGFGSSYIVSATGYAIEANSFNKFVLASVLGVEIFPDLNSDWLPSVEIISRNHVNNIYEKNNGSSNVKHNISSISVQLEFELN